MIERLPAVSFADLVVGDTIMIASTPTDKPDRLIAITRTLIQAAKKERCEQHR